MNPRRRILRGPPFVGQVATRCFVPYVIGDNDNYNSRTAHVAADNIRELKTAWANWYVEGLGEGGTGAEVATGGTTTLTASVEYPAGVFHQVTFAGSATGTIASGLTGWSDWCAVGLIPVGATFWIRVYAINSNTIPFLGDPGFGDGDGVWHNAAAGESIDGGTGVDKTMGGTITDGGFGLVGPSAIVARTGVASLALFGDSRMIGLEDSTVDATLETGEAMRMFGAYASINMGSSGDLLQSFIASHALRLALARYCTHVISNYGINDIAANSPDPISAATWEGLVTQVAGFVAPRPCYWLTMPPETTSTDGWATTVNQTVDANNAVRVAANAALRSSAKALGLAGYFEVANTTETSVGSGIWNAPGYTPDGIHENTATLLKLQRANGGNYGIPGLITRGAFGYMPRV